MQSFKSVVTPEQYAQRIRILQLLAESQPLREILVQLPGCPPSFVHRTRRHYTLNADRQLYYHARAQKGALLVVPQDAVVDTIEREHNAIHHQGTNKTWHEISQRYQGIPKRAVDYMVRQCRLCHTQRPGRRPAPIEAIVTERVMERVQVDMIDMRREPDGEYAWILHIKDHFSRFCMLYPLREGSHDEVVRCLLEWMAMLGPPAVLQTDNGAAFVSDAIARIAAEHHIAIRHSSAGRPRSQGLVERANGHVRRLIAKWCRRFHEERWAQCLPSIAMACNMSMHATVGRSPFEVVFARPPVVRRALPDGHTTVGAGAPAADRHDVHAHISAAQTRMVRSWERRHGYERLARGTHVSVAVHGVDRRPLDDYRIAGVVVGRRRGGGYRVCTAYGVLKRRVPARHVAALPAGDAAPAAAAAHAAAWRAAPRVSLARCVRRMRRER